MPIGFQQTPAREAAYAALHQAAIAETQAETTLAPVLDYLETHRRPDVYARVERARVALRLARRAVQRADARWMRA